MTGKLSGVINIGRVLCLGLPHLWFPGERVCSDGLSSVPTRRLHRFLGRLKGMMKGDEVACFSQFGGLEDVVVPAGDTSGVNRIVLM